MEKFFLAILNMSLTGSFVVIVICLARLVLKKAPKIISYCLWAAAGFRFVFPFSIESMFSLIPFKSQTIPPDIVTQHVPRIDSGVEVIDNIVSGVLPAATSESSMNPLQVWTATGTRLWVFGVAFMIVYGIASYLFVKQRMRRSACVDSNLIEGENIQSPFVIGLIKPKIYIPAGLSKKEREYIILHERTHIRRFDHIIKFVAYFIICLHWFNPLAWVAFLLLGVDIEMSCDERVLKELGGEIKKDYSMSLLSLATDRVISSSPLAFGEDGVKKRIKNVLKFKNPSRTIVSLAIAFVTVLSLGLMVSRESTGGLYELPAMGTAISEVGDINENAPDTIKTSDINEPATDTVESGNASESEAAHDIIKPDGADEPVPEVMKSDGISEPVPETPAPGGISEPVPEAREPGGVSEPVPEAREPDGISEPVPEARELNGISEPAPVTPAPGGVVEPAPEIPESGGVVNAKRVYTITDYYNENGQFSELGLALNERNSEKVLTVSSGDILIIGNRQYIVTIESLTLSYYPQPSLDLVIQWWTDYLNNWAESGDLTVVS